MLLVNPPAVGQPTLANKFGPHKLCERILRIADVNMNLHY